GAVVIGRPALRELRMTGVVMGLWEGSAFAAGDVRANLNQAISLVNNCYAKLILRRGFLLLHASAVSRHGRTVVLAGPPGAGTSTAAVQRLEAAVRVRPNDRIAAPPDPEHDGTLGDPPYFYKSAGAVDPDRPAGSPITNSERARYGELLGRVRVVEVTGRVDFEALVGLVEQLLP